MKKPPIKQLAPIQFLEFWHRVAIELGSARLRINASAKTIHEVVDNEGDARDYLKEAIKKSYKLSRCQHLSSTISVECVLDILGETAYSLQGDQRDDLFDIELLEEIAWHIGNRYMIYLSCGQGEEQTDIVLQTKLHTGKSVSAQVVSFPDYKIRRANSRL